MCGICGIIHGDRTKPVSRATLEAMTRLMVHRGPDGEGYHIEGNVGLGHRRLSIIDVEAGRQPMANEDGTLWLVYNGEIYNFRELALDLKNRGHAFSTRCDTEVILHLYEEYGTRCLDHMRGMFAFALWDSKKRRLFCARDRLGVKPFFYSLTGGDFVFASGPAPILLFPGFERRVDRRSLDLYLTYQYVPSPNCIFDGMKKLPPAHFLMFEDGCARIERYWNVDVEPAAISYADAKERLRALLTEATRLRLVSDVPLGAFLSGGIDSSIVVALMSGLMTEPVKTFSIGFADRSYNELPYARSIASRYKTDHHEFIVEPKAIDLLPKLVWHYGEPFADSSALPTYHVAEMTRREVKVALNGDAGDELFAGYDRYLAFKIAGRLAGMPLVMKEAELLGKSLGRACGGRIVERARRFLRSLGRDALGRYLSYVVYFDDDERIRLYTPDMGGLMAGWDAQGYLRRIYDSLSPDDQLGRVLRLDLLSYLPEDLLVKVDIATMANSLEARSPFLDHKVVEFACSLPSRWKLRGRKSKYILKDAFSSLLPAAIMRRKKMGFGVPIARWFREELREYLREVLLDRKSLSRGYFRPERVRELIEEHQSGIRDHSPRLWALLVLELWHREFIDRGWPK